jgi:hypothetical protein
LDGVWVFNGDGGTFPAGVFSTRERAESWIAEHPLSGCLTRYPVDAPLYEWAMAHGHFEPRYPSHRQAAFIQRFSSAFLEHHHYDAGARKA